MSHCLLLFSALSALILCSIPNVIASPNYITPKILTDIAYVPKSKDKEQTLDLYLPSAKKPVPVIVWIHGGAWMVGDKASSPAAILLENGFACASINYRLTDQARFPAQIHDCKAAIRWLRAHAKEYNLNSNKIGVWGASAGGHLAALLGTTGDLKELEGNEGNREFSSKVQAVCDWCGITDLWTITNQADSHCQLDYKSAKSPVALLLGGTVKDKMQLAMQASPITYVTGSTPPFLIMHGDQDNMVPLAQAQELALKLKQAKVDTTLYVIKGAGHGLSNQTTLSIVKAFFDKHLK